MHPVTSLHVALLLAASCSAAPLKQRATALPYTRIVAFGDSFSDNGNAYRLSNKTWPAEPAYYKGRFSNGPTWIENVASNLTLPLEDYAYGGATSSNALIQGYSGANGDLPVPSVADQVSTYLTHPKPESAINSTLFVLLGGANDVFFAPNITAAQSVGVLSTLVTQLRDAGARQFVLLNYPDLSQIPYDSFVDATTQAQLHDFSIELGEALRAVQKGVGATGALATQPSAVSGVNAVDLRVVDLVPVFEGFGYYEGGWKREGFDEFGMYGSCLTGAYVEVPKRTLCPRPDKRVFWDEYHPTAHSHRIIASTVLNALELH